ncbi:hypothetical protein IWQ47_005090 [Aquimarina sp. EL_43]|uniref:hypothetical protein n=1 Tax=Aquimarina TaxID=290174 RepID=UPI0004B8BBBD|nr:MULTISPECIES: hypothetical protein [Aquimarina]MBG6133618.1 hypothetical protein [Aquimarina sp. EL_35]MBG6152387.1 hypothetical protein [Aquimarina sp. EL_32]MBG6171991.1 hypothetical protein [Aquimarina sp. EL_43]
MLQSILNLDTVQELNKKQQQTINGGGIPCRGRSDCPDDDYYLCFIGYCHLA